MTRTKLVWAMAWREKVECNSTCYYHGTVPSSRPDWIERSIYESEYMNIERFHNELVMRLGYANSMDL